MVDWEERISNCLLAELFILIEKDDSRLKLKCKSCGQEFWKDKNVYYHADKNACSCPKCKKNQFGFEGNVTSDPEYVSQLCEMYSAGKNQKEIVDTLGISYCQARYWLKKKGLYDPERRQSGSNRKQPNLEKIALNLLSEGFAYLGGYENSKSNIDVSCLVCGKAFKRNAHEIPKHITVCPFCKQEKAAQKKAQKQAEYEQYLKEQQEYWAAYRLKKQEEKQQEKDRFLDEVHSCVMCGCDFTYREYAANNNINPMHISRVDCCSKACLKKKKKQETRKHNQAHGKHIRRARKYGCDFESGITLAKLVERDGLRCALCGEMCDWNDKTYGDCGPLYPSIDHIVPMSKGGSHTWDNVQVAHFECNWIKGANVVA